MTAATPSAAAARELDELMASPAPPAGKLTLFDFTQTALARAYGAPACYAAVIDDAFTAAECAALTAWAASAGAWQRALINAGGGRQILAEDTRRCGRILVDDARVAAWMYARVAPLLAADVGELVGGPAATAWVRAVGRGKYQTGRWRMARLNERLRFLKYGPGEFFEAHCDGQYRTPDGRERSFITFQLYLSPDDQALTGGSTTFWGANMVDAADVLPKQGRVLVFQHADLLHSGEEVESGEKITVRTDVMYERVPEEEEEE